MLALNSVVSRKSKNIVENEAAIGIKDSKEERFRRETVGLIFVIGSVKLKQRRNY